MTSETRLTVAFDVKRLADAARHGWAIKGITRYTRSLYEKLQNCTARVKAEPVVFADMDDQDLLGLDAAVEEVHQSLGMEVSTSWQGRNALFKILRPLKTLETRAARVRRIQAMLRLVGRKLSKLAYEPSLFLSRMHWDIYHSPVGPLPPVDWTGNAVRILTVHDCLNLKFPELFPWGTPPIRKTLNSVDVDRDFVICDSESTRRDVMSVIPIAEAHTYVVPLAADAQFVNPSKESAYQILRSVDVIPGKYVLALGQTEPRKNISRLVRAFCRVWAEDRFGDYVLVMVASRSYRDTLLAKLLENGLPMSSFRIIVDVDDEKLAGLYACAKLFAYMSLYEGFGIPPLEAMSAGCPVVVSNTSSIPEVVADAGEYIDPTNVESIAAGLTRVLDNDSLRESLVARGKRQAARFSWDRTTAMTLDFYQEALKTHRLRKALPGK